MDNFEIFYKTYKIPKRKCPSGYRKYSRNCDSITENVLCLDSCGKYPKITLEMEQKLEEVVIDIIGGIGWQRSYLSITTKINGEFNIEYKYSWKCFGTYEDDDNWACGNTKEEALVKLLTKLYDEYKDDKLSDIYGGVRKVFGAR